MKKERFITRLNLMTMKKIRDRESTTQEVIKDIRLRKIMQVMKSQ
jgi:hypothetical protein